MCNSEKLNCTFLLLKSVDFRYGGRFPQAWLEPPRRKLLRGLKAHAIPAGVASFATINRYTFYKSIQIFTTFYRVIFEKALIRQSSLNCL